MGSGDQTVRCVSYEMRNKVFFATRSFDGYNFTALAENKENSVMGSPVVKPLIVKGITRCQGVQNRQLPLDTLSNPGNTPDSQKKKIGNTTSHVTTKPVFGFLARSYTNLYVQPQKMASGLMFRFRK